MIENTAKNAYFINELIRSQKDKMDTKKEKVNFCYFKTFQSFQDHEKMSCNSWTSDKKSITYRIDPLLLKRAVKMLVDSPESTKFNLCYYLLLVGN